MSKWLLGLMFMLSLVCADTQADIFVMTDENGTQHFSDVPNDTRYQLYLHSTSIEPKASVPENTSSIRPANRELYASEIKRIASVYQLDEALLHAVIAVESGYNATVVSKKGAIGLMQLMPDTASRYKVHNSFDPVQNIQAGAQYLRKLLTQFDNNVPLALAAYNAGEKNVIKYGRHIPPYAETIAYVPKVMNQYRQNSLHGP